jgi:hypothetical protein
LKGIAGLFLVCAAWIAIASPTYAEDRVLEMTVSAGGGSGEEVMIVVWAETTEGDFVKTLHMFSKHKEYFNDMLAWRFKSRNKESESYVDGVSGATIKWGKKRTVVIPVEEDGVNLLDGNHLLRIESRVWEGKHYRKFKIALPADYAGGIHTDKGYAKSVEIKIRNASE